MKYQPKEQKWPKKARSWNVRLIPAKLEELARKGVYYESRMVKV